MPHTIEQGPESIILYHECAQLCQPDIPRQQLPYIIGHCMSQGTLHHIFLHHGYWYRQHHRHIRCRRNNFMLTAQILVGRNYIYTCRTAIVTVLLRLFRMALLMTAARVAVMMVHTFPFIVGVGTAAW